MNASITGRTRLVFLAGDPVGHTRGYAEYATAFAERGIDAAYLPADVPAGRFESFLAGLTSVRNVAGVVATVPHKQDAARLGAPDERARRSGAANVLRPVSGGWACTELDGAGFLVAVDAAGIGLAGRSVQLLGAGGAGRSVAMAIASRGPARLLVHDLDGGRAARLVADLRTHFGLVPSEAGLDRSEVLVNCTTVGLRATDGLPVAADLVPRHGAVYDVVNRADTALMLEATERGSRADHGRSMMLAQIPLIVSYLFGA